jgi:hypothetical protein
MKLVYRKDSEVSIPLLKSVGDPVEVGDKVTLRDGERVIVDYFRPPHKTSSEGKVSVKRKDAQHSCEYYVSVIGAEWTEREDRAREDEMMAKLRTQRASHA